MTAAYFDTLGTGIGRIFLQTGVSQLAFSPGKDEIYAKNEKKHTSGSTISELIFRSQDGGETWLEIAALIAPLASGIASTEDGRIWSYPASPTVTTADLGRVSQVIAEYRAAPMIHSRFMARLSMSFAEVRMEERVGHSFTRAPHM